MPPHPDAMDVDELAPKGLFAQNNFFVVRSDGIPEDEAQRVREMPVLCFHADLCRFLNP